MSTDIVLDKSSKILLANPDNSYYTGDLARNDAGIIGLFYGLGLDNSITGGFHFRNCLPIFSLSLSLYVYIYVYIYIENLSLTQLERNKFLLKKKRNMSLTTLYFLQTLMILFIQIQKVLFYTRRNTKGGCSPG